MIDIRGLASKLLSFGPAMAAESIGRLLRWALSAEQQVEELAPVGLKLYPNSYTVDGVVGWHMDDPEIAFPLFQRALDLGLKAVAIHKAIPLGPVPMDHYRMDDIDAAAAAFPDLQFEVVHGAFAFVEETAFQLARFSNVWVNLETTSNLAVAKPGAFQRIMAKRLAASCQCFSGPISSHRSACFRAACMCLPSLILLPWKAIVVKDNANVVDDPLTPLSEAWFWQAAWRSKRLCGEQAICPFPTRQLLLSELAPQPTLPMAP